MLWPFEEAKKIIFKKDKLSNNVVFETGYGPSGLPHIGTFAEVARTTFVMKAYNELMPDSNLELIVFSDDMDGLRSLPDNIPNHDLLCQYLGTPLSAIPDPYRTEKSFATHMNNQLQDFLNAYGFKYHFQSSTDAYCHGLFNEGLQRIMDNYDKIRNLFIKTISKEKRDSWSPFFPICDKCGKIYTTRIINVDQKKYKIQYICDMTEGNYNPCGHIGDSSIFDGRCKVGWKIDWALRWYAFKVDYEMHGKDLIDSAVLSKKICNIICGTTPITYKYELFLDEKGAKISKKIGNGISMEEWLSYAPIGALLHFLLSNPNKAKKMGVPILPRLVDNFLGDLIFQNESTQTPEAHFLNKTAGLKKEIMISKTDINYSLLVNVAETIGTTEPDLLYQYALKYDPGINQNKEFFWNLCKYAIKFVKGIKTEGKYKNIDVDILLLPYLIVLKDSLQELDKKNNFEHDAIQTSLFDIAKKNGIEPKVWFDFLYKAIFEKPRGPRLGSFFEILGIEKVTSLIDDAISRNTLFNIKFHADNIEELFEKYLPKDLKCDLYLKPVVFVTTSNDNIYRSYGKVLAFGPWPKPAMIEGYFGKSESFMSVTTEEDCLYSLAYEAITSTANKLNKEICLHRYNELNTEKLTSKVKKNLGSKYEDVTHDRVVNISDKIRRSAKLLTTEGKKKIKVTTKLLWLDDSYLDSFAARIVAITENKLFLDATAFCHQGGGCPGDTGLIAQTKIIDTILSENDQIAHIFKGKCQLKVGQQIECRLDWDRRYKIMRLHSGSHLMEHFLFEMFGKMPRVGNFLTEHSDNCTYEYPSSITAEDVKNIEIKCNNLIKNGGEIKIETDTTDPTQRYWLCHGIKEPCGSPHIRNISEVGMLTIKRKSGGKGKHKIITRLQED